jgi:hypothetical protein
LAYLTEIRTIKRFTSPVKSMKVPVKSHVKMVKSKGKSNSRNMARDQNF